MHNTLANRGNVSYEPLSENEIQDIQREVKRYLDGTIQDIEVSTGSSYTVCMKFTHTHAHTHT